MEVKKLSVMGNSGARRDQGSASIPLVSESLHAVSLQSLMVASGELNLLYDI